MRTDISLILTSSDRLRLEAVTRNRNTAQKHVWRATIVLLSAEGVGTTEIMRRTGTSKTCIWRWQERFMHEGVDGLLRDKTRPSRIKPLGSDIAEQVVRLTLADPVDEATHWTAAMMARESGISAGLSEFPCKGRVHHPSLKRPSKRMANCAFAMLHSRGGIFHSF